MRCTGDSTYLCVAQRTYSELSFSSVLARSVVVSVWNLFFDRSDTQIPRRKNETSSAVRLSMVIEYMYYARGSKYMYVQYANHIVHRPSFATSNARGIRVKTEDSNVFFAVICCYFSLRVCFFFSTFDSFVNLPHNMNSMMNKRERKREMKKTNEMKIENLCSLFAATIHKRTSVRKVQ